MANQFPVQSHINREKAIKNGDKTYVGVECKHCKTAIKWTTSYGCVVCTRKRVGNRDPEITKKYYKTYRSKGIKKPKTKNSKASLNSLLKRKYGITIEEYEKMCLEQNNKCKICNEEEQKNSRLSVDHCHTTGKVRGLLCDVCNLTIGKIKERIDVLKNMIIYLEKGESV